MQDSDAKLIHKICYVRKFNKEHARDGYELFKVNQFLPKFKCRWKYTDRFLAHYQNFEIKSKRKFQHRYHLNLTKSIWCRLILYCYVQFLNICNECTSQHCLILEHKTVEIVIVFCIRSASKLIQLNIVLYICTKMQWTTINVSILMWYVHGAHTHSTHAICFASANDVYGRLYCTDMRVHVCIYWQWYWGHTTLQSRSRTYHCHCILCCNRLKLLNQMDSVFFFICLFKIVFCIKLELKWPDHLAKIF